MRVLRRENSNTFCGPAALSLITGKSVDDCVSVLKRVRQSTRAVKGVYNEEMREALGHLGYRMHVLPVRGKPTLARILRSLKERGPEHIFLINTTGHYVVLRGRKIYDNKNPEGIFVRHYRHRRARVYATWILGNETVNARI
jgi:hypothetical protein